MVREYFEFTPFMERVLQIRENKRYNSCCNTCGWVRKVTIGQKKLETTVSCIDNRILQNYSCSNFN